MAMVKYGVSTLSARPFGLMYVADTNFGDAQFDIVANALARTPITKDQIATYVGHGVVADVDEDELERFLDAKPQVALLYGRPGVHTRVFTTRLLTDPRTSSTRLLVLSTVVATAFDAIAELTHATGAASGDVAEHGDTRAGGTKTHVPSIWTPTSDEQIFFTGTDHLGTEDTYVRIQYFQEQMRRFVASASRAPHGRCRLSRAFPSDGERRECEPNRLPRSHGY